MDGSTGSISGNMLRKDWAGAARILGIAAIAAGLATPTKGSIVRSATDRTNAGIAAVRSPAARPAGASAQLPAEATRFGEAVSPIADDVPKVAIYQTDAPQNFEISLRLNPASDAAEGGITLRRSSPRDYYAIRIDGRGERVAFLRVSDGRAEEIARTDRRVTANAWHSLRVQAEADRFTVTLDGQWLFTAYDSTLPQAGRLAVWSTPASGVRFDAIAVLPLAPD